MRPSHTIPPDVEDYRDARWRREATQQISTAVEAERFINQVGFAACLTDARRSGPSLYIAVCGRRDAMMPRNVQKDPEASLTWALKDELLRRGNVYYSKLVGGRSTFVAARLLPQFHAIWGVRRADEPHRLSRPARAILHELRHEWEMGTADLRRDSGVREIARAFLSGAGVTIPGELARVTGLSRPDAGLGNRALVAEGFASMTTPGTYVLTHSSLSA